MQGSLLVLRSLSRQSKYLPYHGGGLGISGGPEG